MSTLKQKISRIPSPIREMIVENIKHDIPVTKNALDYCNLYSAFYWDTAKHIPDNDFWSAINEEILLMP
jgi:hypothetical protein